MRVCSGACTFVISHYTLLHWGGGPEFVNAQVRLRSTALFSPPPPLPPLLDFSPNTTFDLAGFQPAQELSEFSFSSPTR